ncbi:MAG: two-component system LytT family sensor kinase [Algoriphagus sp.]|jgi:two-component system LytT family sensor kinase
MLKGLKKNSTFKEVGFQAIVHVLVFLFYAIDRRNPQIELSELVFFVHLAVHANVIGYYLIPKYLYPKKYIFFALSTLLSICVAMVIEELVLEKIFYPDTRGTRFLGVFYTLMSFLPVISILVGFKFAWNFVKTQKEVDSLRSLVKESELAYLKSQINPHFLFNTMNNLYSYAIDNSPKTPELILNMSAVLRYMLYDCKADSVNVSQEIKHLEEFIKISEMQIENRGKVTFTKNIESTQYEIAPLILIVFIENAFKHSTSSQATGIDITVDLSLNKLGIMKFTCVNTFSSNHTHTVGGIGLENVRKRLHLLYTDKFSFEIKNANPPSYDVLLTIDLNQS